MKRGRMMNDTAESCPHCAGKGVVDSGGVTPWGACIEVPCSCLLSQKQGSICDNDYAKFNEEYQKFVESMVPFCRCSEEHKPCDGVLAGGCCEGIFDEPDFTVDDLEWEKDK